MGYLRTIINKKSRHIIGFFSVLTFLFFAHVIPVVAQCAMCRATVESTVSEGSVGIAAKLNTGILYLFVIPYLVVSIVGILWYKTSKRSYQKNQILERRRKAITSLKK